MRLLTLLALQFLCQPANGGYHVCAHANASDAIVQEDLMKAVRKLNDAKKHETGM